MEKHIIMKKEFMNGCGYTQTVINEVEEKKNDLIEFGKLKKILYDNIVKKLNNNKHK